MTLPTISNYTDSSSSSLITIGPLEFYFSYDTIVAVRNYKKKELVCIRNYWGPTTGKHLNAIQPDKEKRLSKEDFNKRVEELLS